MSHSTGSAVIQYSRAGPLTVKAASSARRRRSAPPRRRAAAASAAATFGGTVDALGEPVDVDLPFVGR